MPRERNARGQFIRVESIVRFIGNEAEVEAEAERANETEVETEVDSDNIAQEGIQVE
jgi:hypothetical protein